MGPRSGDRGNTDAEIQSTSPAAMLQWGRDLVIAEMRSQALDAPPVGIASMGPRSGDRGNRITTTLHRLKRQASMGPRSGDRGNIRIHTPLASEHLLQWGRDLVIAEMKLANRDRTRKLAASMGPRSGDRGNSY